MPPPLDVEFLNSYPFSASRAVASRVGEGSEPDLVVVGLGSGIQLFKPDDAGILVPTTMGGVQRRDCGGVVRAMVFFGDHLYVAAQRAGLIRFDLATWTREELYQTSLPEQAWRVAIFPFDGKIYAVLGTNTQKGSGRVVLLEIADPVVVVGDFDPDGEVWSVAASRGVVEDEATILVGTACKGVLRWDLADPITTLGTPDDVLHGPQSPLLIRGLAIHVVDSNDKRAYAAAHDAGLRAIDLNTPGALDWIGGAHWPYQPPDQVGLMGEPAYVVGLSLDAAASRLALALGPWFAGEEQTGAHSQFIKPCTSGGRLDPAPGLFGVQVVNVADRDVPAFEARFDQLSHGSIVTLGVFRAWGVALRRRSASTDEYAIDVANNAKGAVGLQATLNPDTNEWGVVQLSHIADTEGAILHTCNIPLVIGDALYLATELGIATFDISMAGTDPASLLQDAASINIDFDLSNGSISISSTGGPKPRIYGTSDFYIHIANVEGPKKLAPTIAHKAIERDGRGHLLTASPGLPWWPWQRRRWLYFANNNIVSTASQDVAAIRLWEVGTATQGGDPQLRELGRWLNEGTFQGNPLPAVKFGGVAVLPVTLSGGTKVHAVYIPYASLVRGPSESTSPYRNSVGLYVFEARNLTQQRVMLELKAIVPIASQSVPPENTGDSVWTCTVDEAKGRVYACFGSTGLGVYDIDTDPFDPVPLGQVFPGAPQPSTLFQALPAGDRLYLSVLDLGIGVVLDATTSNDPSTWQIEFVPTRLRCIGLALDPSDQEGETLYVGDSMGGVHRIRIQEEPS